ncbi:hypothetical protein B0H10DRAFT_2210707 [Mycena sp. CBHHK59/15]|nr:hypothetical protein B0H10DRAFT_2210707 [Mycena sp. CBHHK59/15]
MSAAPEPIEKAEHASATPGALSSAPPPPPPSPLPVLEPWPAHLEVLGIPFPITLDTVARQASISPNNAHVVDEPQAWAGSLFPPSSVLPAGARANDANASRSSACVESPLAKPVSSTTHSIDGAGSRPPSPPAGSPILTPPLDGVPAQRHVRISLELVILLTIGGFNTLTVQQHSRGVCTMSQVGIEFSISIGGKLASPAAAPSPTRVFLRSRLALSFLLPLSYV